MSARRARLRIPDRKVMSRLVRAAQRDDAHALDALLAALRPAFVTYFARRIGRDVAEDLTQAALIRAARSVARMHPERIAQHMTTIARTLLQEEHLRSARERRLREPAAIGEHVGWPVDLERHTEYDELVEAVASASALALSPELRTVVLGLLGGRSMSEIATELGIEPATVRVLLLRARTILRRELRPYISH